MQQIVELQAMVQRLLANQTTGTTSGGTETVGQSEIGLSIGATVETTSNLRVRTAPGSSNREIATVPAGLEGVVVDGPRQAGLYNWWMIDYADGTSGWSAENWLRSVGEITDGGDSSVSFDLEDVSSITYEYVDPNEMMADEEYYIYTISLQSGEVVEFQVAAFTSATYRTTAFRNAGYVGDIDDLLDMAEEEEEDDANEEDDSDDDTSTETDDCAGGCQYRVVRDGDRTIYSDRNVTRDFATKHCQFVKSNLSSSDITCFFNDDELGSSSDDDTTTDSDGDTTSGSGDDTDSDSDTSTDDNGTDSNNNNGSGSGDDTNTFIQMGELQVSIQLEDSWISIHQDLDIEKQEARDYCAEEMDGWLERYSDQYPGKIIACVWDDGEGDTAGQRNRIPGEESSNDGGDSTSSVDQKYTNLVNHGFTCILERPVEPEGKAYYEDRLSSGAMSPASFFREVFNSVEYQEKNTSNSKFVEQLYQCLLFRPSKSEGKAWWIADIEERGQSRMNVITSFINGDEFKGINVYSKVN